jgi:hypothetical protein
MTERVKYQTWTGARSLAIIIKKKLVMMVMDPDEHEDLKNVPRQV